MDYTMELVQESYAITTNTIRFLGYVVPAGTTAKLIHPGKKGRWTIRVPNYTRLFEVPEHSLRRVSVSLQTLRGLKEGAPLVLLEGIEGIPAGTIVSLVEFYTDAVLIRYNGRERSVPYLHLRERTEDEIIDKLLADAGKKK